MKHTAHTKSMEYIDPEQIGAFIRDIRKEKGFTQEQLAERLGVSQKSISRWETGRTMPDYALLPSLCEALEINVAELLGAARIEGDSVPKKQVTIMAHTMISLIKDRRSVRKIAGAVISAAVMLFCAVGLYTMEFSVSAESTASLEDAINQYHFDETISSDILECQTIGDHLYVLYGEKLPQYQGACGLACLEKGLFGNYRVIRCHDFESRWIQAHTITEGKTRYCVTFCANRLEGIDAYGVCGVKDGPGRNLSLDDAYLLYKLDYPGGPFLTFTAIDGDTYISPSSIKYYRDDVEIPETGLAPVLGPEIVDDAPSSGYGAAEPWLFYVLEGIVILLGILFIRYFLTDFDK